MRPEVTEAILGLSKRIMTMKAIQEGIADTGGIGEREFLILSPLKVIGRSI